MVGYGEVGFENRVWVGRGSEDEDEDEGEGESEGGPNTPSPHPLTSIIDPLNTRLCCRNLRLK